jgi:predicted dehydrogenase
MAAPLCCIHVGVHRRGEKILKAFASQKDRFQQVALVDATPELAFEKGEVAGLGSAACFGALQEAINSVTADACVITSPARFHREQVTLCLNNGLHVFVAKPMSYDLQDSIKMVELAEKQRRCLIVDQQQQFYRTEQTLAQWVREERYGKVGFASFSIHRYRPDMAAFTEQDPFVWEQGVHSFNSLIAILGRQAVSVSSIQTKPRWSTYNGATVAMGVIEFEGGVPCHYLGSFDSPAFTMELRLDFEKGSARAIADNAWAKRLEFAEPGGAFKPTGIEDEGAGSLELPNIENFYRGCVSGGRFVNDGRDNLRTLAIADAFIRSAKTHRQENVQQF